MNCPNFSKIIADFKKKSSQTSKTLEAFSFKHLLGFESFFTDSEQLDEDSEFNWVMYVLIV